jgi:hypothetical protein
MNKCWRIEMHILRYMFYLMCISISFIANSKTIYLSNSGSDLNNGSFQKPIFSFEFACKQVMEGDTLCIRGGKYYLHEKVKLKSNTFIYAYNNERVEIHGTVQKNEWIKMSNDIWKIDQKDSVIQLFINSKPYFQAAFPSIPENGNALKNGAFAIASASKEIMIQGLKPLNSLKNIRLLGIHGKGLVSLNGRVIKQNGNIITTDNDAFYWNDAFKLDYLDTGKAFVYGSRQFQDDENEWYWENNELYLKSSKDPNELNVEIRTINYGIDGSNISNCIVQGITFFGTNLTLRNSIDCKLISCSFIYPTPFFTYNQGFEKFSPNGINGYEDPEKWNGNGPDWNKYDGPETWHGNGIEISGENNTIENCYIAHSWGDGLTVWGNGHKIKNNIITDCNWIGIDCAPLNISGENQEIQFNELSYGGRSILLHRFLKNSKITNNHIHHGGLLCNDQGLTYSFWTDGKGTEIAYNYLHDNLGTKNQTGIYLDNWTYNYKIHHNIINNAGTGININKPHNNHQIYNNTLFNNNYSMGSWGPDGTELRNVETFNNLTNTNKKAKWNYDAFYGTEMDSNYVYFEDNIFLDPQNHNFQLRKYSYPIDKGITSEFTVDFNGSLPDLGAIESGSIPWEYGSTLIVPNEKYYVPKAPVHLKIVPNTPEITLFSWEYPFEMVDSFYIERKLSTEDYRIIARIAATNLTFNDAFQAGGEYRYQIRAKNAYGISEPSNTLELFNPFVEKGIFLDAENADQQKGTKILGDELIELDNKDWIVYKQVDFGDTLLDACKIRYAVPCSNAWQNVQLRVDGFMGKIIGEYITESTSGWDIFEENNFPIEPTSGVHDVYIKFRGKYGVGTIDWFELYNSNGTIEKTIQKDPKCPQPYATNSEILVKLFPNPGNDLLRVSFENKELAKATVEIYNTIGHKISSQSFTELYPGEIELYIDSKELDLGLKNAFYLIKVNIESENHTQETILKYIRL